MNAHKREIEKSFGGKTEVEILDQIDQFYVDGWGSQKGSLAYLYDCHPEYMLAMYSKTVMEYFEYKDALETISVYQSKFSHRA
jgi:hypothetical protein